MSKLGYAVQLRRQESEADLRVAEEGVGLVREGVGEASVVVRPSRDNRALHIGIGRHEESGILDAALAVVEIGDSVHGIRPP